MDERLCLLTACEQARLVREGDVSARELTAAHLARIDRLNPRLNAVVTVVGEAALEAADAADRRRSQGDRLPPLHGLPIAIKDLADTAGIRTTYGSPLYRDHVPEADDVLVERLRSAGVVVVGKTNTPEWGAGSHTFNQVFGVTRNPWDTSRSVGGSSGGAAAALAARLVPIADGSDLGGSVRNPAAWNGVIGLRPTPGVVPRGPSEAPWMPFSVAGPMGRTAADVALLLGAMAGADPRDPLSQRAPAVDLAAALAADVRTRRVAWSPHLGGLPVEPAVLEPLERMVADLPALGLEVEIDEPDLTGADRVFETWRGFLSALQLGDLYETDPGSMKPTVRWDIERGRVLTGADLVEATRLHAEIVERARDFFTRYDYLACPVTQVEPFPVEVEYPTEVAGAAMATYIEWMRSCSRITVTCCPAISVPAGFTAAGLPAGLQLVAAPFAERSLLELAAALEPVSGMAGRVPPENV